jgi:RNA polymerase subunit RPABC4/transcription elongation factor Spt4
MSKLQKEKISLVKCKRCHTLYDFEDYGDECPTCGHNQLTEAKDVLLELDEDEN